MNQKTAFVFPGMYVHHKGGRYEVVSVAFDATNERNGNQVVVYVSRADGKTYCRDLLEFTEPTVWPDGETRPRFIPGE